MNTQKQFSKLSPNGILRDFFSLLRTLTFYHKMTGLCLCLLKITLSLSLPFFSCLIDPVQKYAKFKIWFQSYSYSNHHPITNIFILTLSSIKKNGVFGNFHNFMAPQNILLYEYLNIPKERTDPVLLKIKNKICFVLASCVFFINTWMLASFIKSNMSWENRIFIKDYI